MIARLEPPELTGVDHGVDRGAGGGRDQECAEDIDTTPGTGLDWREVGEHLRQDCRHDDPDRDVDPEDPRPAGPGGEDTPDQNTDSRATAAKS
jgi:hypothetical protein